MENMKYIRTKDGKLFEYNDDFEKKFQLVWWQKELIEKNEGKFYLDGEIIVYKIADTIEELCDGLIVEEKGNESNWFVMDIDEFKNLSYDNKQYQKEHWNFYAFIKTDKGLIYVAKMNDKGELKLL